MKLRSVFICIVIAIASFNTPSVLAEEISTFDTSLDIQSDGTVRVNENILYDFGTSFRHGIYRTIPYTTKNKEGKKFLMDLGSFNVVDDQSMPYTYTVETSDDVKNIKIGDADKTISGKHKYSISYTAAGALTYFSDHDELYWNITGNGWGYPIRKASATVSLPKTIDPSDMQLACYTGAAGSTEIACSHSYAKGIAKITTSRPLDANEGFTIVVGFPKNIVSVLEPREYVSFWDTFPGKILIFLFIIIGIFWYIYLPISIPIQWWRHGRDPKPTIGTASAWFSPPKTKGGSSLTPGETGTLVDERADMQDVTATIIHLAQRGYMKIIESQKGAFSLKKNSHIEKGNQLLPFEQTLYDGLFVSGDTINLKTAKLATLVETVKNNLYDAVVTEGFFEKNPQTIRVKYGVLAGLAFFTGNFQLLVSSLLFGLQMPKKTLYGAETAAVALSLKKFLTSQERQLSFQAKNQMMFEKLLPFAVAFSVEKIWAKRFADISMKQPDWYQGHSTARFNSILLVNSIQQSNSSFASAATPVSSSTGHSSGFSGGFSGGGGGGGGGGSW
jgi:uncharacterized membrane protein